MVIIGTENIKSGNARWEGPISYRMLRKPSQIRVCLRRQGGRREEGRGDFCVSSMENKCEDPAVGMCLGKQWRPEEMGGGSQSEVRVTEGLVGCKRTLTFALRMIAAIAGFWVERHDLTFKRESKPCSCVKRTARGERPVRRLFL